MGYALKSIAKKIIFVIISYILGPTTPTFSLSEERSFDGSPKINVVFANGKSDTMILTKFDNGEEEEPEEKIETEAEVEECRYHKTFILSFLISKGVFMW